MTTPTQKIAPPSTASRHDLLMTTGGNLSSSALHQWRAAMIAAGLSRRTIAERIRTAERVETDLGCPLLAADTFQLSDWIARGDVTPATRAAWHSILSALGPSRN